MNDSTHTPSSTDTFNHTCVFDELTNQYLCSPDKEYIYHDQLYSVSIGKLNNLMLPQTLQNNQKWVFWNNHQGLCHCKCIIFQGIIILLCTLYGTISLISVVGNALVIWVVASSHHMQNVTNFFIANLGTDISLDMLNQKLAFLVKKWKKFNSRALSLYFTSKHVKSAYQVNSFFLRQRSAMSPLQFSAFLSNSMRLCFKDGLYPNLCANFAHLPRY